MISEFNPRACSLFFRLFTFVALLCALHDPLNAQNREAVLDKAYQKILSNDLDESIMLLSPIIAMDSTYYDAYYLRGMAYFYKGNNLQAMEDFQYLIQHSTSTFQHVYYYTALLFASDADFNHAIFCMGKEIEKYPNSAEAYFKRGYWYMRAYTYDTSMQRNALGDLQKAVSLDTTKSYYYFELGRCQKFSNKRQEAIVTLNKAIKMNPYAYAYYEERNTCHELVGSSYIIRKKDLYEGVKNLKKYRDEEAPGIEYYYVGNCFKLMYDFTRKKVDLDSAMYYFNKALAMDSNNVEAYLAKGRIYRSCYRSENKACMEFKTGVEHNPQYAEMWLNYGWSLERLGKKDEAYKAFEQAFLLSPPEDFRAKEGLSRTR